MRNTNNLEHPNRRTKYLSKKLAKLAKDYRHGCYFCAYEPKNPIVEKREK